MNRPGRLRSDVAWNAAGKRELPKQSLHASNVFGDLAVVLAVRAFEVSVRNHRGSAVTRTCDVDHVEVVTTDHPVEMNVYEVQAGRGAPMPEQTRFDVFERERIT